MNCNIFFITHFHDTKKLSTVHFFHFTRSKHTCETSSLIAKFSEILFKIFQLYKHRFWDDDDVVATITQLFDKIGIVQDDVGIEHINFIH